MLGVRPSGKSADGSKPIFPVKENQETFADER
jgi:hypothetical protein